MIIGEEWRCMTKRSEAAGPAPPDMRSAMAARPEIKRLRKRVEELEQANSDLEIALTIATEHGDAIEQQMHALNSSLRAEIRGRVLAERRLSKVLEVVSEQNRDLEILVETITEHSDGLDAQWVERVADIERLAKTDALTKIGNMRLFNEIASREWKRCQRSSKALGVCMLDIDFFKGFNDTYGHPVGDDALVAVARTLTLHCNRPADLGARYGGEEFVALLPETDADGCVEFGKRLCADIAALAIPHERSPHGVVTVSVGAAAQIPTKDGDPADLVVLADAALYRAKALGRNCVFDARDLGGDDSNGGKDPQ